MLQKNILYAYGTYCMHNSAYSIKYAYNTQQVKVHFNTALLATFIAELGIRHIKGSYGLGKILWIHSSLESSIRL